MDLFLKLTAGILLSLVMYIVLGKSSAESAAVLSIAVCCICMLAAAAFFEPVVDFCRRLQTMGNLDSATLQILLKAVGIGLLSQVTVLLCGDAGNQSLGKALQIVAVSVILWLCLPLLENLISLLDGVLGAA